MTAETVKKFKTIILMFIILTYQHLSKPLFYLEPPCYSSPCKNGGNCENDGDAFTCSCRRGYEGKTCEEIGNFISYSEDHAVNFFGRTFYSFKFLKFF